MANKVSTFIKKKFLGNNKNLISLDEPFEVIKRLLKGHNVTGIIDAGASNGRISKRLLRKFPAAEAYAFEPNRLYFDSLQQYAKENPRFHPYFVALSDREGSADLLITRSPGNTSLFTPGKRLKEIDPQGSYVENREKVEVVTIDEWTRQNNIPSIELMKFDIQGGELKALYGATRVLENSTLLVYTEIWFNYSYEGGAIYSEIDLFFREHGFVLYDIFKPRYHPNGLIMWANAVFLNPERLGMGGN
jgi:FkbM family methyltransferase